MTSSIFFLNAGVRLTTKSQEIVPLLKEIEARGVEIYSCGTCQRERGEHDLLGPRLRGRRVDSGIAGREPDLGRLGVFGGKLDVGRLGG